MKTKLKQVVFYKTTREIPEDMLRYDCAFVSHTHPGVIAFPRLSGKHGQWGGKCTMTRWESFLVRLTPITEHNQTTMLHKDLLDNPDQWYTATHPKNYEGVTDYNKLELCSFSNYIGYKK